MAPYTTPEDVKAAHETLHATYKTGITKSIKWRKWQLKQLYWMLNDNETAIAGAIKKDLYRSDFEALIYDIVSIKGDILDTINRVEEWAKGEAPTEAGFIFGRLGKAWLRKEPLGVALIIGAWNFPLVTLLGPAVAAIAAGNCVMLKPSELASSCQDILVELVPKYLDQSAIRVCTGGAQETGLLLQSKFDHIFYTGGGKVGRIIATAAAKNLTPVVLELGGQAPAIVTKTANLDISAKRIAHAKMMNAGQVCLNVNHVFAEPEIHDELVKRVIHWMKEFLKAGTNDVAHIISSGHFSRVTNLLKKTQGNIVYKGNDEASTNFVHPAIITDVTASDSLMSEELFAPLLPIIKADMRTAVETVSSMPHPLALYIFSSDQKEIDYILNNTASGGVTINDVMIHSAVPSVPFGGVGESGHGAYHGKYGFEAFSHIRPVVTMPSYLEMVMSWRYAPLKVENRKYLEGQMPKVNFRRGEGMEDQPVGKSSYGGITTIGAAVAVLAIVAVGDRLTGNRVGLGRGLDGVFARFRS